MAQQKQVRLKAESFKILHLIITLKKAVGPVTFISWGFE
jgi:hypothetical protein